MEPYAVQMLCDICVCALRLPYNFTAVRFRMRFLWRGNHYYNYYYPGKNENSLEKKGNKITSKKNFVHF